jgi:hypothetical protein
VNATLSTVEYVSKVQHLVKCGVAVTKGQAVYVTTSDGTNMIVGLASNATEPTSSKVIGLAASTGAINDQIFVVTEGLIAGLNTSTATAGDPVWLGTGGNLIFGLANKPVAPAHLVYLGVVTRVQSNNGEIFVNVQNGFELNELHDVLISSPSAGQLIRRDSDGLWKNWSPNFLTSYTETDPIFSASAAAGITSTNITNWNTAYNDSIRAIAFNTTNGILTLTQQDAGTLTVDLDGRYLTSFSESDPVFEASAAAGITNEDIAFWNTAYGWGNHADYGYLTSYTETDPIFTASAAAGITSTNISNWNTAYGWGNHASAGYATQTWVGLNYYNEGEIDDFFSGAEPISGYNKSNWDTAYNDRITTASVTGTSTKTLTLTQGDGGTVTATWTDYDTDNDAQVLTWTAPSKELEISNGNSITLDGLATEDYVLSQGFITGESDTLATVTGRGATTSVNNVQFNDGVTLRRNVASGPNVHTYVINSGGGYSSAIYIGANPGADWLIGKDAYGAGNDKFQIGSWNGYAYIEIAYNTTAGTINFPNNGGLTVNNNTIWHAGNDGAASGLDADLLDGYHETSFIRLAANSNSPTNGVFAIGSSAGRNFIQSHSGQPLDINPLGNAVNVGSTLTVSGAVYATATVVTASEGREVQTYMPSSYTTDDLVAGHEYGWYSDHWRLGMTRTGGAAGGDFVVQWNGARRLSLTNGGGLVVTGNVVASGGNSTQWNAAYGWGNHADAPYWNVSLNQDIQVEAQNVTFAGNVIIQGTLTESSSIRFKENIQPLEPALAKVEQLNPVTYTKITSQEEEIGLIAEEVAELFPEVVTYNEAGQPQGVSYSRLSVILLKAMQEQNAVIAALTERVNKLENK